MSDPKEVTFIVKISLAIQFNSLFAKFVAKF